MYTKTHAILYVGENLQMIVSANFTIFSNRYDPQNKMQKN